MTPAGVSACDAGVMGPLDTVDDVADPLAARIRTVAEGEHRRNRTEIIVENEPNIRGARRAGVEILHLFVTSRLSTSELVRELASDVPTSVITDATLEQLFLRTRLPQVFAIARLPLKKRF